MLAIKAASSVNRSWQCYTKEEMNQPHYLTEQGNTALTVLGSPSCHLWLLIKSVSMIAGL